MNDLILIPSSDTTFHALQKYFISKGKFNTQTFSLLKSTTSMNVPKLKSVSLAVDSNWGADFTCIYRVRVHGH